MSDPWPDWFPKALAIARHQDEISRWPWRARVLHRLFVSWRCPCCVERAKSHPRRPGFDLGFKQIEIRKELGEWWDVTIDQGNALSAWLIVAMVRAWVRNRRKRMGS